MLAKFMVTSDVVVYRVLQLVNRTTPVGMRLVADPAVREHIDAHGGAVYVWPKLATCCRVRTFVLESATEPPDCEFDLVHAADGFQVYTTPGFVQPEELHLELTRRGRLRAYWNGQGWIG